MVDADQARDGAAPIEMRPLESLQVNEMRVRVQELVDFRDAGVLSDAELEEQKAKLRWGVVGQSP